MKRSIRVRIVRGAAVVAVLSLLAGCTSLLPAAKSTPAAESVAAGLKPFYSQVLKWSSCETGMQCATAKAPLDWSKPSGDTITLALIRHQATGTRLGSLLVNPGGPGGSGYDMLASGVTGAVDKTLAKSYDIVSWDPRGVGRSSKVTCGTNKYMDGYLFDIGVNDVPASEMGTDAWFDESDASTKEFGAQCLKNTGALLGHVGTNDTARDLDMLRAALGDKKLTYLGYSYGTLIGAVYAQLFPSKTGRLVLDGAVDPAESYESVSVTQSKGFESALRAYLTACIGTTDCPFTGTVDEAVTEISQLFDTLDASPIKNSDGRELGGSTMSYAIDLPLYSKENWPYLDQLFTSVFAGDASVAFALADSYFERDSDGTYSSNLFQVFQATTCLDYPAMATRDEARADAAALADQHLLFGNEAGYASRACYGWPYKATRTVGPITAKGSSDIVVVGTTNDPATPYANAVSLAGQLEHGHLVSYTGEGHTAYNGDSTCVNTTVDDYFIDGTVPTTDPHC